MGEDSADHAVVGSGDEMAVSLECLQVVDLDAVKAVGMVALKVAGTAAMEGSQEVVE